MFDRRGKAYASPPGRPEFKRSGKLPATLAKARPLCAGFSARLTKLCATPPIGKVLRSAATREPYGRQPRSSLPGIVREDGLLPAHDPSTSALGVAHAACVALLERPSRHEHPRAATAQRVSPERGCIARQHDERDEDVLAETARAFTQPEGIVGRDELKPVAREQTRHLPVALRTSKHQGAAHDGNVVEIASPGEITRKLRQ